MTVDQARKRKFLARWHQRLALVVFAWLILLSASGLLINHAHDWGLDQRPLPAPLQRWVYGIDNEPNDYCSEHGAIGPECTGLFASFTLAAGSLLLDEHSLYLVDDAGELVEKLAASQLGLASLRAALHQGSRIFLRDGSKTVVTDIDLMDYKVLGPEESGVLAGQNWKEPKAAISVTWERLLLDLHAARFLGPAARFINDLLSGFVLLLAISGLWLYRHKRKGNGRS